MTTIFSNWKRAIKSPDKLRFIRMNRIQARLTKLKPHDLALGGSPEKITVESVSICVHLWLNPASILGSGHALRLMIAAGTALAWLQVSTPCAADEFTLDSARVAAEKGEAEAEYYLARHYAKGEGVPQDYAKAAGYMRQAAEQGNAFAQNDLGVFYAKGLGVKQDYQEAVKWYRQAAENGDSLGQFSLGWAYAEGRGLPTNLTEALKWYRLAAVQNQPDALLALGYLYQYGEEGVSADNKEACQWFEKAAAQGRFEVLNNLGFIYEHGGHGVTQDLAQAVKYYQAAAEKNIGLGQMNLGRMYQDGSGVKPDLVEAYKWFYLASLNGTVLANHYLKGLTGQDPLHPIPLLTPEQIQEARRRADEFKQSMGR